MSCRVAISSLRGVQLIFLPKTSFGLYPKKFKRLKQRTSFTFLNCDDKSLEQRVSQGSMTYDWSREFEDQSGMRLQTYVCERLYCG